MICFPHTRGSRWWKQRRAVTGARQKWNSASPCQDWVQSERRHSGFAFPATGNGSKAETSWRMLVCEGVMVSWSRFLFHFISAKLFQLSQLLRAPLLTQGVINVIYFSGAIPCSASSPGIWAPLHSEKHVHAWRMIAFHCTDVVKAAWFIM